MSTCFQLNSCIVEKYICKIADAVYGWKVKILDLGSGDQVCCTGPVFFRNHAKLKIG